MHTFGRDDLQELLGNDTDVTLVEVLTEESFAEFHLPEAVNVPLKEGFEERIQEVVPDKSKPVVVYCANAECDASSKAARRLDELGYEQVYDYEGGKADWKAAGLPVEP
ncbi:MAG: rhodanese-like domain-containing protein [Planctomycetota bacterium]|nr:MAG: rhodanese-like domain-containing protein [Planctomycetota bacterium]